MMKYLSFYLIFLFSMSNAHSQCYTTHWLNPTPTGNPLKDVFMVNDDTAFAVGDRGTIIRTFDGGQSWDLYIEQGTSNLNSVFFVNSQVGFTCGVINNHSTIYKTSDGGDNWINVFDGYQQSLYGFVRNIQFTGPDTGYVYFGTSRVLYTVDGGDSWGVRSLPQSGGEGALFFLNGRKGFVSGNNQNILRTDNTGLSWTSLPIAGITGTDKVKSISFADSLTGFGLTLNGRMAETTDGGATWTYNPSPGLPLMGNKISFPSPDTGFALVSSNVYRSVDTGNTWQYIAMPSPYNSKGNGVSFSGSTGLIVTDLSNIFKTSDYGNTWTDMSSGFRNFLYGIDRSGANTLFAAGSQTIQKSVDNGISWNEVLSVSSGSFFDIQFLDSLRGWATGSNGLVRKTINGGQTWTSSSTSFGSGLVYAVHFVSQDTGFVGTSTGGISKSINGGQSFLSKATNPSGAVRDIHFANSNTGYAVGANGFIAKTSDGGEIWVTQNANTTIYLTSVFAINDSVAFAGGNNGHFFRTSDGGDTWIQSTPGWGDNIQALYFENALEGYMIQSSFNGIIYKTINGGITWSLVAIPTNAYLFDLHVTGDDIFVVGSNGWVINIKNELAAPEPVHFSRCDSGYVDLTVSYPAGYEINWYSGAGNNATLLASGYSTSLHFSSSSIIYVSAYDTLNNCHSPKKPVVITIEEPHILSGAISATRDTICTGESVTFVVTSNGGNIIDHHWFLNGSQIPANDDTLTVNNLMQNDSVWVVIHSDHHCLADSTVTIPAEKVFVSPQPVAGFSVNDPEQCFSGHLFSFTDTSDYSGPAGQMLWTFPDGSNSTAPAFDKSFNQSGSYLVGMLIENLYGCADSTQILVEVHPNPVALIAVNDPGQCFSVHLFEFTDNSTIDAGYTLTSSWDFGDGTNSQTGGVATKIYNSEGNYPVQLISTSDKNCADTAYQQVTLFPAPLTGSISGNANVQKDSTEGYHVSGNAGSSYEWIIENGTGSSNSNSIDITWTLLGTGSVKVVETDINGCKGDTVQLEVVVHPDVGIVESTIKFHIHPVPASDMVYIQTNAGVPLTGRLYNTLGEIMMEFDVFGTITGLDVTGMPSGLYLLKISGNRETIHTRRIILVN